MRRLSWSLAALPMLAVCGWAQNNIGPQNFTSQVNPTLLASTGALYGVTGGELFSLAPGQGSFLYGQTYTTYPTAQSLLSLCFEGGDGNLYGFNQGSQFVKISLSGTVTMVSTSAIGNACPVIANDGNYYGGSATGGQYSKGALYQITQAGKVSVIYNFTGTFDGSGPSSPMVQGSDGNLYGFGSAGFFRYSATKGLSIQGSYIGLTAPVEASDGNFYSYNYTGYENYTVEEITPSGTANIIYIPMAPPLGNYINEVLQGITVPGPGVISLVESDIYEAGCGDGNTITAYGIDLAGTPGGSYFTIGYNGDDEEADTITAAMFPAGSGVYYGGYTLNNDYYQEICKPQPSIYSMFYAGNPATTNPPIQMSLSTQHVRVGGSATLTWQVNNAFSATMQQCYGYGALSGKVALSGSKTITAPVAGVFPTAIICGGTETGIATLIAGGGDVGVNATPSVLKQGAKVTLDGYLSNLGTPAPTGSIQFKYGSLVLATVPLDKYLNATYTASTAGLAAGTYDVVAYYPGDANYGPGSATAPVTILPTVATKTVLTPSTQTVNVDTTASLTATVTGTYPGYPPTGTVNFMYGSTLLGTVKLVDQNGTLIGTATLSQSTHGIPGGTYQVEAVYSGDGLNLSSTSAPVTVVVQNPADSAVVSALPNPVPHGASTTLTATVKGISTVPTGTVAFYAGTHVLASTTLNGGGVGSVTIASGALAAGSYSVTAYYAGDSKNPPVTSPAITLVVQ